MVFKQEIICSRQNQHVVLLCKLSDRKEREKAGLFRFDGIKLLEEALRNGVALHALFFRASSHEAVLSKLSAERQAELSRLSCPSFFLSDELFDKISEEKSPEGVICIAKYIDKFQKKITIYNSNDFLKLKNEKIVLLESVRDPSNIGAIIRSAAAFGIDRLLISADCADIYHPKAVRASMGTLFSQVLDRTEDLPAAIRTLRETERRVYAATLDERALTLGTVPLQNGDCVVIGNEGHGLTRETVAACDGSIIIPMSSRAESLNAAVAASILMWEFSRSREPSEVLPNV